ncbi:MAG: hypothetical protein ACFFCM_00090 [Promethearchaeota archaeon]
MPQLVKGGKYVFGWSKVGDNGRIVIPKEALEEYNLTNVEKVILMPGSKRSGGFGLSSIELLKKSKLSIILEKNPKLSEFQISEGELILINGKAFCWVRLQNINTIIVPIQALKKYGIKPEDYLLSVRGSKIAIGFPVRGPLIEEAKKHLNIKLYE